MTKLKKRVGALALSLSMTLSLFLGSMPVQAAETEPEVYKRPELVMDFLGDNKVLGTGNAYQSGKVGDGTLKVPADVDQGSVDGGADQKWNGYVSGDVGPNGETIFWIGIGIKDIKQFVLSNEGKGLYSAELGLYYNPTYVEPYDTEGVSFQQAIETYDLGGNGRNQWSGDDYRVVQALTDQDPLNDPIDTLAVGDPTVPTQGYGTQEFPADTGWRMAYVSVEMKDPLGTARFIETDQSADDTYYIAMIPFVLKGYDSANKLCIRLARNASAFSIGSAGTSDGEGIGAVEYGNWDKYTYHDPEHDLKLMFDYTGDLNIFTNKRERDQRKANLIIKNPDSSAVNNYAQMVIDNEPYPAPSQLADASGESIEHLSGGEVLRVSAHTGSNYTVSIKVERLSGSTGQVGYTTISTPVSPWSDEWTFIMPSDTDVTVTVTFDGSGTLDTEYELELEVDDGGYDEPNNTAKLQTTAGGPSTDELTTGTDTMKAKAKTPITVAVKRNSDYDVVVTWTNLDTNVTTTLTPAASSNESLSYVQPEDLASDVKVKVEFKLAEKYLATLTQSIPDDDGKVEENWAKLSYTDGKGVLQSSSVVDGKNPNTGYNPDTKLNHNQIQTRSGRTVTVETGCDPRYQVKQVSVYRNGAPTQTVAVTRNSGDPSIFTFTMPAYGVEVIVEYERVQTYGVKLLLVGADETKGETATLTGKDGRGTHTTTLSQQDLAAAILAGTTDLNNSTLKDPDARIDVFSNASMAVTVGGNGTNGELDSKRTATVRVYYASLDMTDPANPTGYDDELPVSGSAGNGFTFNMAPLDHPDTDMVYVVVTFEDTEKERLTARIREDKPAGAANTKAVWSALNHSNDIGVYEGDTLNVTIQVEPGFYIANVQVYDAKGDYTGKNGTTLDHTGAPLGVPVTLSGIGYNGGNGGTETASFVMPSEDATLLVEYAQGEPPKEPSFTATIRAKGGEGTVHITNNSTTLMDTYKTDNSAWVDAKAEDKVIATYAPAEGFIVLNVEVSASVPGTAVSWQYAPGGGVSVTMPASNVVVTVTFAKAGTAEDDGPQDLTLAKEDPGSVADNTVSTTTSGGSASIPGGTPATKACPNELVVLDINVAAGYHIDGVKVTLDDGTTVEVPVTLSGNGYNDGNGGTETAVFNMPMGAATATVTFAEGEPRLEVELVVTEPKDSGNTADLIYGATETATAETSVTKTAKAGDLVKVKVHPAEGYQVDIPVLATPTGVVSFKWTDEDTFQFVMPEDSLTVTVPFKKGKPTLFYANIVLWGDPTGVAGTKATFGDYTTLQNGPLAYSRQAQAGERLPYAVAVPDGYYISEITVTPASFDITPSITGMIGTQRGEFTMPAGNVNLNITIAEGWPDEVLYPVTLHVTAPNDGTRYSYATLENLAAETPTATGNVPATKADTSGSAMVRALDGNKLQVVLYPDAAHVLDSLALKDGEGNPVSYQWTTYREGANSDLALEFSVPGSSVDVYVDYVEKGDTTPEHEVRLHVAGNTMETVTLSGSGGGSATGNGDKFDAAAGESIGLTVSGSRAFISAAYAVTKDGTLVALDPATASDPALAGSFVDQVAGKPYGFLMPFDTDVDVYLTFNPAVDVPEENEHTLTLTVTGPADSGNKVTVNEFAPSAPNTVVNTMDATPVGGNAMVVTTGNTISSKVEVAPGCALYSLIAYTDDGTRVVITLDDDNPNLDTYVFTMPANTTHIEAEFRRVKSNAYQIQVVVNNTVNGGQGLNNDALLYLPEAPLDGFKFKTGVSAGDLFELGISVDPNYQVDSIIAVPQGSGVMTNIPLPATSAQRAQVKMPASNLVIYVTFRLDTTTRYNVLAETSYLSPAEPPTDGTNSVTIEGRASGQSGTANSNSEASNTATIQEAASEWVDATWSCAPNYWVSKYTISTAAGDPVLSQPKYDDDGNMIGAEFIMPAAPVVVNVEFTNSRVEGPQAFTATLHYLDHTAAGMQTCPGADTATATDGDLATIVSAGTSQTTSLDGGSLSDLLPGDQIDISATPGENRYLKTIYVLQNGPTVAQTGQMLPLNHSSLNTTDPHSESTADISMPSGDVDIYVVFTDTVPDADEYVAVVKVNSNTGAGASVGYATLSYTQDSTTSTSPRAECDGAAQSLITPAGKNVTVSITISDPNYEIDSVVGTPIGLRLDPQVVPGSDAPVRYTFTMPADNASIIVNLREKTATKYRLNLTVSHSVSGDNDDGNQTMLAYGSPAVLDSITVSGSGTDRMDVPAGRDVTLTVTPQKGYFVRAAYVVYDNELVTLTPEPLKEDSTSKRLATGLEGATDVDVTESTNTAVFKMPAGTTDVFVVYEAGEVPETPWYNVVVIATDTGGVTANTGRSEVQVSSIDMTAAGTNAIDPAQSVLSNGVATNFYSVPVTEKIQIDATRAATAPPEPAYQYDAMSLSCQDPSVTLPALTNADPSGHPLGEIQEFSMVAANVGVHVNFKTTGTIGLTATLHVVKPTALPGHPKNTVALSVGSKGTDDYRCVDNSVPEDGTQNVLTSLVSGQTITTLVQPKDPGTRVVQVAVTELDDKGNPLGSTLATPRGTEEYTYNMGNRSVLVYVVLTAADNDDVFVATATPLYENGVTNNDGANAITGVTNTTRTGMNSSPFWTEVRGGDQVKVEFKAEEGVYAAVSAVRAGTSTAIPVAQFGAGNGAAGYACLNVPDPGCDVTIVVTFSNTPPAPQDLTFRSEDHDGLVDNVAKLKIARAEPVPTGVRTDIELTPTADDLTALSILLNATSGTNGADEQVIPGTALDLNDTTVAANYSVKKVEVVVHTTPGDAAGDVTVTYYMDQNTTSGDLTLIDAQRDPVDLLMPTSTATITVYFEPATDSLLPYDPDNPGDEKYDAHSIRAENRGDHLIVTVPLLNNKTGTSPTDVVWEDAVQEDRFNFYLWDGTGTEPAYTSVMDVIELRHPDEEYSGNMPYELGNFYTDPKDNTEYNGARFILTVKSDDIIDAENSDTTAAASAKELAAILRQIMDNDGTKQTDDKYSLYITCEETKYDGDKAQPPKESDKVDFEVPRYYSLAGELASYAPTHITNFTLSDDGSDPVVFTSTLQGDFGDGLWRQDFVMKLTSDFEKLSGKQFTLTIEKAGHVTYVRTEIVLDPDAAADAGCYDAAELQFSFSDSIEMICGDMNGDGEVKSQDVDQLVYVLYGYQPWTTAAEGETGWEDSVYNPDSFAYVADLNGDGVISTRDMDVLTDLPNYNHSAEDYGGPTGLSFVAAAMLMEQGPVLPEWAEAYLEAGGTLPAWAMELLESEEGALPDWAMELIEAGEALPEEMPEEALPPADGAMAETPEVGETPEDLEKPEEAGTLGEGEGSGEEEQPKDLEDSETLEVPEKTDTTEEAGASGETVLPEKPETPDETDTEKKPEDPKETTPSEEPETTEQTDVDNIPGTEEKTDVTEGQKPSEETGGSGSTGMSTTTDKEEDGEAQPDNREDDVSQDKLADEPDEEETTVVNQISEGKEDEDASNAVDLGTAPGVGVELESTLQASMPVMAFRPSREAGVRSRMDLRVSEIEGRSFRSREFAKSQRREKIEPGYIL